MVQRIPRPLVCAPPRRKAGDSAVPDFRRIAPKLRYRAPSTTVIPMPEAAGDTRLAIDRALDDILRSVTSVVDGRRAFLMLSRDHRSAEIAATRHIRPGEILHLAVTRVAQVINRAFTDRQMTLADRRGAFIDPPTARQEASPAWICAPFTAAMRINGVLCIERGPHGKGLTSLDLDIVQALTDQAATALAAVRTHDALSRLNAALGREGLGDAVGIGQHLA